MSEVREPKQQIGVRVDRDLREAIDSQRGHYPRADGGVATRSEILRAMLEEARVMFDRDVQARVRAAARERGITVGEAWALVVKEGLMAVWVDAPAAVEP